MSLNHLRLSKLRERYGANPYSHLLRRLTADRNDGSWRIRELFPLLYEDSYVEAEEDYWVNHFATPLPGDALLTESGDVLVLEDGTTYLKV